MPRMMNWLIFAALLSVAASAGAPRGAFAATHDGNWSVLIVTEKGDCDRGYRYNVKIANGHVSYRGDAAINLAGTVANNGAVSVNIKMGQSGASGIGHLSTSNGSGTWRGIGATGNCAGRWEAERRE